MVDSGPASHITNNQILLEQLVKLERSAFMVKISNFDLAILLPVYFRDFKLFSLSFAVSIPGEKN